MAPRKTTTLLHLVETVNHRNRYSVCKPDIREGWNQLCSKLLLDADAYAGFRYLGIDEVPEGHAPGIRRPSSDPSDWRGRTAYPAMRSTSPKFEGTDPTRIAFFLKTAGVKATPWAKTEEGSSDSADLNDPRD